MSIDELKAENARLKAEVERLRKFNDEAMAHIAKEERKAEMIREGLETEVERLHKAGDAMQEDLLIQVWPWNRKHFPSIKGWNAAKEGKPSA